MKNATKMLVILIILSFSCSRGPVVELSLLFHSDTPGWAHDISLDETGIYISDRHGGFLVFDKSLTLTRAAAPVQDVISLSPNSGLPVLASRFEGLALVSPSGSVTDRHTLGDIANAVEVRDGLAFAAYGVNGLVITRLAEGRALPVAALSTKGWSHDIRLSRDEALLADWQGLRIVDIHDPARPVEVAFLPSEATCISLAVKESGGKRLVALAEGHGGVALASLEAGERPVLLGRHYLGLNPADPAHPDSGGWVHSVAWAGRDVVAANWKRGLAILDAADPRAPELLLEYPVPGTALGVKTQLQPDGSHLVFLAGGESGFWAFRLVRKAGA
ncbi:MAG: hypothetical protein GXX84_14950 [Acidobacteria bacterium]|nr:hypothetical protein [Acidobacteriota bacterium]